MTQTLVLTNGRIHTMNPDQSLASAMAVRDGRIVAVGEAEIKDMRNGGEWIDLGGRAVVPGLVDAHVHFQWFAQGLQNVDLDGSATRDEALARISAFAERQRGQTGWLRGRGWTVAAWPNHAFPTAAELDAIVPDRPALLSDKSGHAAWANSLALRMAGISAVTANPPGGQIQRDALGHPTGILFEEAIDLVAGIIPRPTTAELAEAMRAAQAYCWSVGLTGIHDFDGRDWLRALQLMQ